MTNTKNGKILAFVLAGIALLVLPLLLQATGSNSWARIVDIALLYVLLSLGLAPQALAARAPKGEVRPGGRVTVCLQSATARRASRVGSSASASASASACSSGAIRSSASSRA